MTPRLARPAARFAQMLCAGVLLALPLIRTAAHADEPAASDSLISAKSAILVDVASGQILFERDADVVRFPASLTKVMTALLALEMCDVDKTVTVSETAAAIGEATAYLEPGDQLSLRDLLLACLLRSANDASVAVAEHAAGTLEDFVDRMNSRATELEMGSTHFVNPNGLHDPNHVSTARDLSLVSRAALLRADFRAIVGIEQVDVHYRRTGVETDQTRTFPNTNRFMRRDHEHYWALADGVKTGYTRQAGRCLIGSATQGGSQLLAVVLDCESGWVDARALIEWGFRSFRSARPVVERQTKAKVHVVGGRRPAVMAVPKSSISVIVPAGFPTPQPRVSEFYATAPISEGDVVGEFIVSKADGTQARATLIAVEPMPQSLGAFARSHAGIFLAGTAVLAILGALLIHGATAEAVGARRRRSATRLRRDDQGRPSERRRQRRPPPRSQS